MKIYKYNTLKSTNDTAKEILEENAVITADEQTAGKGRHGKSFFSPKGGIYMSIITKTDSLESLTLSAKTAVAVCRAIINLTDKKPEIKWINDIYIENEKVGGILIEGFRGYAIVGIGINLIKQDFPDNIEAVSLDSDIEKEKLILEIAEQFSKIINDKTFISDYKSLSNIIGKDIFVYETYKSNHKYKATVIDISDIGELIINTENQIKILNSTRVTIRKVTL